MTATFHALGHGSDAGLYYVNDGRREAHPRSRDEYYVGDGGGIWWSSGETVVAHGAPIVKASFRDLCAGRNPATGASLVRGAGETHRAGWDLTFSAPKALSVLWAMGSESERADFEGVHGQAVDAALAFVQRQQLLEVRLGAGGTIREQPSDLIIGRFQHYTSRAGDPQLHTHCVIMNIAGSADGKHRTLEPDTAFRWTLAIGAAYRAELSRHLVERGFRLRQAGKDQIEIAGIDEAILETFSERSRQIEELVGDRRTATGAQKQIAALATRAAKAEVPTGATLEARWRHDFAGREPSIRERVREAGRALHPSVVPPADVDRILLRLDPVPVFGDGPVAVAASRLLNHESVIARRALTQGAMVEASLRGLGIDAVEADLQAHQEQKDLLVLRDGREALWTTLYIAEAEAAMREAAARPDERLYLSSEALDAALMAAPHLTEEQRSAVADVADRDGVSLVEAGAGTGKTTIARVIKDAAERSGLRVIALAPTYVAADELSTSTGVPAQVVAKFRAASRRQQTDDAFKLDAKTVILLDEAGMLGTLDMSAVLVAARKAGAKIIAFGDRRQLASVAQGSALSAVSDQLSRVATLKAIRRQSEAWQRAASVKMFEGDIAGALDDYWRKGAVRFADNARQAIDQTIATWAKMRAEHDEVAMITRTNRDVSILNAAARQSLRQEGALPTAEVQLPTIDRDGKRMQLALSVGDKIRFRENISRLAIRNGTRAVVTGLAVGEGGDAVVTLRLGDGSTLTSPWMALTNPRPPRAKTDPIPRVVHAYAGTTYAVQGRTVDAAVFHIGSRTDAREAYVAMTRHRHDAAVIVDGSRLVKAFEQDFDVAADNARALSDVAERSDPRLLALQDEATRLDEKANVYSVMALPAEPSQTRDRGLER